MGVIISSVIMMWGLSLISGTGEGFSGGIFSNNARIEEHISIDNVNFKSKTIYVRNYGDIPIKIRAIYVDEVIEEFDETITARNSKGINVTLPFDMDIIVRLATERGTQYEEIFNAP
ncbi:hypothetical protein ACFL96_11450 [Thermoproteota archaeon]